MEIQESVIVLILDKGKILLQKNRQWNDLSFVGGKKEEYDGDDPIETAYREVEEELGIKRKEEFTLERLKPGVIELNRFSKRKQEYRNYRICPFFLKMPASLKTKLEAEENCWIELKNLSSYSSQEEQISALVLDILPSLDISNKESFQ
ncbi:MAG: NUDIX hydrolase [Leptospiraceae bacterium]|nr:NUDIX hydrolase [Leptospiraceae bacterium]MCP5499005.1 NUDIX hydrolase [Leptospiraceae bacterium]